MAVHRRPGRLALLGWAWGFLAVGVLELVLFGLSLLGLVLLPVGVGVVVLLTLVPAIRGVARWQRRWTSRMLGREVGSPYLPVGDAQGWSRVKAYAVDIATWRDLVWLPLSACAGAVSFALYVGLLAATAFYLIYPWLWAITPDGVFDLNLGFLRVDDQRSSFVVVLAAVVPFTLWLLIGPGVMRARAYIDRALLAPTESSALKLRVAELSESRAEAVDTQAAELRRIERDLHDGAQARLVSLGMSLGMAEELLVRDPEAARRLLAEARDSTSTALSELRHLVRGIHPPVLADRGLDGAIRALALASPVPTQVHIDLPGRLPAPVESATYFCVAESLANVIKHSRAPSARIRVEWHEDVLRLDVYDAGVGGAVAAGGTGLRGIARRLNAFDGRLDVDSPPGGPTTVHMEVPCVLSSPKISPSSGTA